MPQLSEATMLDVCALVTDGTHDTPQRVESGFPLIKAKEIVGGRIDFATCDQISEEEHLEVIARSKPEYGDTLFAHIGASLGEAAYVNTHRSFSIKNIALFKPNPKVINGRYLFYVVISPYFQELAKRCKTGSAQPFLSLGHLRSHRISYHAALPIQRKIASVLSAYDDLIENNTRRIAILEAMAQAIYREWFVEFRFAGHEKVKLVASPLGKIPAGWKVGRLDEVLVLQRGFDLPIGQREPGDVPIYAATGIVGTHNEARVKGPGVLTGRSGSLGTVLYVHEDHWPLNTALWVKAFHKPSPLFAYYTLRRIDFPSFNSGAAVPTLNRNDIHGLPTVIPPDDVVRAFDRVQQPFFTQARILRKKNTVLRTTRDLLLPKLISGQLDVEELDIETEEAVTVTE